MIWTHGTPKAVRWMLVEGNLGDRSVWARWEAGHLSGDADLLAHARFLVDLDTVFVNESPPACVPATLEGPAAAVMLTLAHACDRVSRVDFEVDEIR